MLQLIFTATIHKRITAVTKDLEADMPRTATYLKTLVKTLD